MIGRIGTASLVMALCACSSLATAQSTPPAPTTQPATTDAEANQAIAPAIAAAVASPNRTEANRARDRWRHPAETLSFFRLAPGETVVELIPGGGWYTEILGSYVAANGGTLYTAAANNGLDGVRRLQAANAERWGHIRLAEFPTTAAAPLPAVPAGTADLVVTFRNVHNWRFAGTDATAAAFRQAFAMLKPGGRLGIVDHRLPENMDSALEERSGYMKVSSIIAFAQAAGFELAGQSEINANPDDTHDYPGGVWTLPPTLRGADTDEERARRRAIGESDRMTLLFIKPAR